MSTLRTGTEHLDEALTDPGLGTRMKVCGAVGQPELAALASERIDFVGLWWAVPGGPHDLAIESWRPLAAAAVEAGLTPVLVTFTKDLDGLADTLAGSPVHWVQLHGYPTPGFVRKVKAIGPEIRVIKVLHVNDDECVEASLLAAYEHAGVDVFLFDAVAADGRVGSTGQQLAPAVVTELAERLTRPFLLAGGISARNRERYSQLAAHSRFLGIDVDTNARGADGAISAEPVAAIARAWRNFGA